MLIKITAVVKRVSASVTYLRLQRRDHICFLGPYLNLFLRIDIITQESHPHGLLLYLSFFLRAGFFPVLEFFACFHFHLFSLVSHLFPIILFSQKFSLLFIKNRNPCVSMYLLP